MENFDCREQDSQESPNSGQNQTNSIPQSHTKHLLIKDQISEGDQICRNKSDQFFVVTSDKPVPLVGSKLLRLINKPSEIPSNVQSSNGNNFSYEASQGSSSILSNDEAQLFALLKEYNKFRKLSDETLSILPTSTNSVTVATSVNQNLELTKQIEANRLNQQLKQSSESALKNSPQFKIRFDDSVQMTDNSISILNSFAEFATPNKFQGNQRNGENSATTNNTSSTPGTNASGSSDLDLYLKQISSDFERKKNFTHETALPQSDEQEMSLYVDNLTGEDVTHTERGFGLDQNLCLQQLQTQSRFCRKEQVFEFESCSQFFQANDLIYVLNETSSPQVQEQISPFQLSADRDGFFSQSRTQEAQTTAADEISRVKIDNKQIGAHKLALQKSEEFDFPEGGWVCSSCQNYNFFGRLKCNRCLKVKSKQDLNGKPKHLLRQQKAQPVLGQKNSATDEVIANSSKLKSEQQISLSNISKNKENQRDCQLLNVMTSKKISSQGNIQSQTKQNAERVGDWVCIACTNLNFAFRQVCNRCWRDRNQTATMVLQDQSELQKFQSAGCTTQYLQISLGSDVNQARRQALTICRPMVNNEVFGALNSDADCFQPGSIEP